MWVGGRGGTILKELLHYHRITSGGHEIAPGSASSSEVSTETARTPLVNGSRIDGDIPIATPPKKDQ
jgi:hypothetical protein